jgi:hypothetical protein
MSSLSVIHAQVERQLPGALTPYLRTQHELIRTGISPVDALTGGIPKGALTQLCAAGGSSSGKTTLLLSMMAQLTNGGEYCALVDAGDCFDPASADAAGVELRRVLWVRCGERRGVRPLEQVFKAADIVIQNGGFGLIAIDLGNIDERFVRKIPLTTWFRFARVIERLPTALVLLTPFAAAQSCAALTLEVRGHEIQWQGSDHVSHARLIGGVDFAVEIARARTRKPPQSVRPEFSARAQWV